MFFEQISPPSPHVHLQVHSLKRHKTYSFLQKQAMFGMLTTYFGYADLFFHGLELIWVTLTRFPLISHKKLQYSEQTFTLENFKMM